MVRGVSLRLSRQGRREEKKERERGDGEGGGERGEGLRCVET